MLIREYTHSAGSSLRVDRERGIIENVKILGLTSRNGRTYLPDVMRSAATLYEGVSSYVNHGKPNERHRDYESRIGIFRNVRFQEGSGLHGDFHFNPKHPVAEQLIWDAEHATQNIGFSPVHDAKLSRGRDGKAIVEAIHKVASVDLVSDPATTNGLYEATALTDGAGERKGITWDFRRRIAGAQEAASTEVIAEGNAHSAWRSRRGIAG